MSTGIDACRLALGTLSAIPVRPPRRVDRVVAGWAMILAPVVFLPVLVLLAVMAWAGVRVGVPSALLAVVLVTVTVLISRGIHLDGLADTCDGLSCGPDRTRALAAMRSGDTGPSGAMAIVLTLLLQVTALAALIPSPVGMALAGVAVVVSRHVLAWGCLRAVPPARTDGLGAPMAASVSPRRAAIATTIVALTAGGVGWAVGGRWWDGPIVATVGLLAALLLLGRARRRLGGMTGDVLGAMVEVCLAVGLITAAVLTSTAG